MLRVTSDSSLPTLHWKLHLSSKELKHAFYFCKCLPTPPKKPLKEETCQGLLWCSIHLEGYTKGNISYICKGIEKFKPGYKEKELDTEETEVRYFKGEKKGFSRKGLQRKCFGDVFPTTNESSM